MNSNGSSFSTTKDESTESSRNDTDCQQSFQPEAQGELQTKDSRPPPSSGVDRSKPTVPSSPKHDNQICDIAGCERVAEENQMSQDGPGGIERVCAEHKKKSGVIATAVTRAAHCQFTGCDRTPRYGTQDGHLSFCQAHKRAGQYTVRNGQLFVATRDGSAFRGNPGTKAVGVVAAAAAAAATCAGPASAAATTLPQDANALLPVPGTAASTPTNDKVPKKKNKKNRPCIFPGCEIRPHYGFLGERSLFCVTHKKDGMVHLLGAAAKNLKKEAQSRGLLNSHLHAADSKAELESKDGEKNTAAATEKIIQKQKDRERASSARNTGGPSGKESVKSKSSAQKGLLPEKTTEAKDRNSSIMSSPASAREKESPLATSKAEAPGLPPSGLAPSDEIRLFQEARESARAAAEASGSGRRPRAPSRKLLEASGKLMCDSIQWMTKEKREEEARFKQEMKEQRKAAAAAGLKFGHRMEALAISTPVDARAAVDGAGTTRGTASAGARTGVNAAVTSASWRKLTPAETLIAAGKQPSVDGAQLDVPASKVTPTGATGVMAKGKDKRGETASVAPATAAKAAVSARKRKVAASAGESTIHAQGARRPKLSRQARRRVEGGDSKGAAE